MKKYLIIIAMVVLAVVASFYLIPDAREMALMQFRDKEYQLALESYERQLDQGNVTVEVASTLTALYQQYGEIDNAISVMEKYVAAKPNDLNGRLKLGELYKFAQRQDEYISNLAQINRIKQDPKLLQAMNQMYAATQQYDKQEPALSELSGIEGEEFGANRFRSLAQLQASQGKPLEAIASLQELWKQHPEDFIFDDIDLLMTLQLEQADNDAAYASVVKYIELKDPKTPRIARLANVLHYRGDVELADRLLLNYNHLLMQDVALTKEKTYVLLAKGEEGNARDLLYWLQDNSDLDISLQREYIYLLVLDDQYAKARDILGEVDFSAFQESDVISLIEIAQAWPKAGLMPIMLDKRVTQVNAEYYLADVAYAIVQGDSGAKQKIDSINKLTLTNAQNLQMAAICDGAKNKSCTREFLNMVDVATASNDEKRRIARIYMNIGERQIAKNIITPLYELDPENRDTSEMYVRLAASEGDSMMVERWLLNNPTASESTLLDLFYTAQKYRQSNLSYALAQRINQEYPSQTNQKLLVDAYIANRDYAKALPYYRAKNSLSREDRENYLFLLAKLAPKSSTYSKELISFAKREMSNPAVSQKQRTNLIYALLDVGRPDVVMPFIKDLAQNKGGQWIDVYANNLDKLGRFDEARDFRMQLAMNPNTSHAARRAIAFQLLEKGYKNEASDLFLVLADNAPASSTDVQQLLFLEGTRPDGRIISWLLDRYEQAPDAMQAKQWATYIANYTSQSDLINTVKLSPNLVNEQIVQARYFDSLYQAGQLPAYGDQLLQNSLVSAEALRIFARKARAYNLNDYALVAYRRLNQLVDGDAEALRNIGLLAFSVADYSETEASLVPYLEYREENPGFHVDDYQAYFYLAETMKRNREMEASKYYYKKALQAVAVVKENSVDSISKTAQSLIGNENFEKGRDYFEAGIQQFPTNRLLVADYASSMIELKKYDKAESLLAAAPPAQFVSGEMTRALALPASDTVAYSVDAYDNEVSIEFNGPVPQNFALLSASKAQFPWLSYVGQSYDKVLIVAEADYQLQLVPLQGSYTIQAVKKNTQADRQFEQELAVRYEMLGARIDLETGEHYEAAERLKGLVEENPENATLLGYTANALNFTGRWKHALIMLDKAHSLMPQNEDIQVLQRDISLRHDEYVKVDYDWVRIGDSTENIWSLSGLVFVDEELEIGGKIQTVFMDAEDIRRIDGRVGDFSTTKERGEIYIAHEDLDGQRVQASLYANNDDVGLGLSYGWLNPIGVTRVYGEYHRPNWEFVEGILDDATRDRIGFDHLYKHNTLWTLNGGAAFNRYNLKGEEGVADSVSAQFSATRQLREASPYLALNYSLDAEYRVAEKTFVDNNGEEFVPLLDSREVHTLSVIAAEKFSPQTEGLVQAGYSYDRLGGSGPLVAGELTHQMLEDQLEAQVRGSYGSRTGDKEGDAARLGGHLKWRF